MIVLVITVILFVLVVTPPPPASSCSLPGTWQVVPDHGLLRDPPGRLGRVPPLGGRAAGDDPPGQEEVRPAAGHRRALRLRPEGGHRPHQARRGRGVSNNNKKEKNQVGDATIP